MQRHRFVLLILAFALAPFAAAQAADPFTVSAIKLDATAASATEASNVAISAGRHKAWDTLLQRLVRQQDVAKLSAIDDTQLQRMIRSYDVANERRSTTRYVGDATFVFNGDLVRRFLRSANIAFADGTAKPILVIPMAPSYVANSAWAAAWAGGRDASGVPLTPPVGDAADGLFLGGLSFDTATWNDVAPTASRIHATQVALILAKPPASGQMVMKIRILSAGQVPTVPDVTVPIPPGTKPQKGYGDAAAAAAAAVSDAWKSRTAIDFNQHAVLTALVHLDSLAQWGGIQQKLASVPIVTSINVAAMNIGQARIVINYAGSQEQLTDFLSQTALSLTNRGGKWWLSAQSADGGMETQ